MTTSSARLQSSTCSSNTGWRATWRPMARRLSTWSSDGLNRPERPTGWLLWMFICLFAMALGRRSWYGASWKSKTKKAFRLRSLPSFASWRHSYKQSRNELRQWRKSIARFKSQSSRQVFSSCSWMQGWSKIERKINKGDVEKILIFIQGIRRLD